MTVNYSPSHAAGFTTEGTITEDRLYDRNTRTRKVTIPAASGLRTRGEALGKITKGTATVAVKAAGANTGTGTFTIDPTSPVLANATSGLHTLRCITAAANGGRFELKNPAGLSLGLFDLPGTAAGTVAIADRIKGVLADSGTDFVVGDGFDITVAVGSGKYVLALAAALDGSDEIDAILLHDVDATAADQEVVVALSGDFATQGVIFGTGKSAAESDTVLRAKGIFLKNIIG